MKTISGALADHLAGDTMTTARLWKIKRKSTQATAVQAFFSGPNVSGAQDQIPEGTGTFSSSGSFGDEETVGNSYAVADLGDNNTSASASWTNTSNGNAVPKDTSKVPITDALYAGATTRVLAHVVGWFYSGSSHISVGYFDDATQVTNMVADMKSRGINGVILDWYGQGSHSDTVAGYIKSACEADGAMTFVICIDNGAISSGSAQADFESAVNYVNTTYFSSTAYEKHSGRPLLLEFGCEKFSIDWNAVRTYMNAHGNPLFIWQDLSAPTGSSGIAGGSQNAFAASYTDGAFSWVGVSAVKSSDPEALNYLRNFYNKAKSYPAKLAMGSVRKGFNDALASWGSHRVMTEANGSTWADSFQVIKDNYSSSLQLPYLQVVTWDDYEEGTEVETGIATNLAFGAVSASGNSVNWSTTGNLAPYDHIGVYASSDGGVTYDFLGKVSKLSTSVDLVGAFSLAGGTYKVRLRAVGISSIQSVESADVTITVSGSGGVATFLDWEQVSGQWRTTSGAHANSELEWLYASDFGLNIPATATVTGISCLLFYNSQSVTTGYLEEAALFNGSSPIGTVKTPHLNVTPSVQTMNLGGQGDAWGYGLTASFVNSSAFGFGIRPFYDGVRVYISGFAVTVYYTLPASSISGGQTVSIASSLTLHTNFTGEVEADTSANAQACGQGASPVFDSGNVLYINNTSGVVHYFDGPTGALLGTLGTFGTPSVSPHYSHDSALILYHPTRGKWLVITDGTTWGMNLQLMSIAGLDGSGSPIAPGTVTNVLGTMYSGISSGGNNGGYCADTAGNLWVFGWDNGGAFAGIPRLQQIGFTADTTIGVINVTDFNALYSWTNALGVQQDPVSGNLVLWGSNGSGDIAARVDQNASFAILASSTTLIDYSPPRNMGANGQFIAYASPTFAVVRASDFSTVQSGSVATWGAPPGAGPAWYDPLHNFLWLTNAPNDAWLLDLNNPSGSGSAHLSDAGNSQSNSSLVTTGGLAGSPDGNYFATNFQGGSPSVGFIDFWGAALLPAAGTPAPTQVLGFTDHDLDILYDDGSGDGPILYVARTGATWSAIESKADFSVDNVEIESFLESDLITETDLRGGLYDGAECTNYLVNWADLTQKHLVLRYGVFGSGKIVNGMLTTEIRGLAYKLGFTLGGYYQPLCRAELFSTPQNAPNKQWYCNLNSSLYQQNGSVASSADALHIVPVAGLVTKGTVGAGGVPPAGYFDFGLIKMTSGSNQNLKFQIESWDGTTLTLDDCNPLPYPVAPGDTFVIEPGCDKLFITCRDKYANGINHRGEKDIPGLDAVLDMFPSA